MHSFTPGPWETAPELDRHWIWIGPEGWRTRVARVCLYEGEEGEQEANARLIAAAPDLLAFAKAYDAEMQSTWTHGPDGHPATLDGADRDLWLSARAAILRATGEQS